MNICIEMPNTAKFRSPRYRVLFSPATDGLKLYASVSPRLSFTGFRSGASSIMNQPAIPISVVAMPIM